MKPRGVWPPMVSSTASVHAPSCSISGSLAASPPGPQTPPALSLSNTKQMEFGELRFPGSQVLAEGRAGRELRFPGDEAGWRMVLLRGPRAGVR